MQNNQEVASQDLLAAARESLVESHIVHDFEPARVLDNLAGCYGTLIQGVYREMLPLLKGRRIIDCGCGFGQFSQVAINAGFEVTSVDIDDTSLAIASEVSRISCRRESIYATSLPDGSCDTAVCCDSIQHFDIGEFVCELNRLGVQRIVIYDSNISSPLLALYRSIAGHRERNDRTADAIVCEFFDYGYDIVAVRYENVVSLPISGGFQRRPVPLLHRFPGAIQRIDRRLERVARLLGLDRFLTFRFLLVLDRRDGPKTAAAA
jgi:SAM-dependent methyltransferase